MKQSTSFRRVLSASFDLITFRSAALVVLLSLIAGGCKDSSSVEVLPYYITPASALDPEPDEEMLRHLLDSSTVVINRAQPKGNHITTLEDSIEGMVEFAVSKVSAAPATHIPYVWGGKHVDKPTQWSQPPVSNSHCAKRVGLDCSGFVQYVFEHAGFGRQAPELNVASLSQISNWDFIAERGYLVLDIWSPKVSELLPGDVLIFEDGTGALVHTGIFWKSDATLNGNTTPAFIHSAGRASCDLCYAQEAQGKLTGVSANPLGPYWQGKLVMAIRIIPSEYVMFFANGYQFFGGSAGSSFLFRSTEKTLHFRTEDTATPSPAIIHFKVENFTGLGTFSIRERDHDSSDYAEFWFDVEDDTLLSSQYTATKPPNWWHGENPPPTGGEVNILSFAPGRIGENKGSIAGTFRFKANYYYWRYEDSTYFINTVKYTKSVPKYYYDQTEVTGRFGGIIQHW